MRTITHEGHLNTQKNHSKPSQNCVYILLTFTTHYSLHQNPIKYFHFICHSECVNVDSVLPPSAMHSYEWQSNHEIECGRLS